LPVLFGSANQYNSPSILFNPNTVYFRLANTPINGIYLSSVVVTAIRPGRPGRPHALHQPRGCRCAARLESRRLVQLDGVNSGG